MTGIPARASAVARGKLDTASAAMISAASTSLSGQQIAGSRLAWIEIGPAPGEVYRHGIAGGPGQNLPDSAYIIVSAHGHNHKLGMAVQLRHQGEGVIYVLVPAPAVSDAQTKEDRPELGRFQRSRKIGQIGLENASHLVRHAFTFSGN